MADRFRLTVRRSGRTNKARFATLPDALDALDAETRAAAAEAARAPRVTRALGRDYEPVQQVVLRAELRGPGGVAAGIDVRGDGSAEAFTGRVPRRLIAAADREDAWAALRRVVAAAGG
jgi:hypothetical protein